MKMLECLGVHWEPALGGVLLHCLPCLRYTQNKMNILNKLRVTEPFSYLGRVLMRQVWLGRQWDYFRTPRMRKQARLEL